MNIIAERDKIAVRLQKIGMPYPFLRRPSPRSAATGCAGESPDTAFRALGRRSDEKPDPS